MTLEEAQLMKIRAHFPCQACNGTGYDYHMCPVCMGKGVRKELVPLIDLINLIIKGEDQSCNAKKE